MPFLDAFAIYSSLLGTASVVFAFLKLRPVTDFKPLENILYDKKIRPFWDRAIDRYVDIFDSIFLCNTKTVHRYYLEVKFSSPSLFRCMFFTLFGILTGHIVSYAIYDTHLCVTIFYAWKPSLFLFAISPFLFVSNFFVDYVSILQTRNTFNLTRSPFLLLILDIVLTGIIAGLGTFFFASIGYFVAIVINSDNPIRLFSDYDTAKRVFSWIVSDIGRTLYHLIFSIDESLYKTVGEVWHQHWLRSQLSPFFISTFFTTFWAFLFAAFYAASRLFGLLDQVRLIVGKFVPEDTFERSKWRVFLMAFVVYTFSFWVLWLFIFPTTTEVNQCTLENSLKTFWNSGRTGE